jgi:hypothetical protein
VFSFFYDLSVGLHHVSVKNKILFMAEKILILSFRQPHIFMLN